MRILIILVSTWVWGQEPQENWHATSMEGSALLGEIRYQSGDFKDASETFRDSLNSSVKVADPYKPLMGLDLYRSAELAITRGDIASARRHLEILTGRYPDSEFADKGRRLLATLAKKGDAPLKLSDELEPAARHTEPGPLLESLKAAYRAGKLPEAAERADAFLKLYPSHPRAVETRLTLAAVEIELKRPGNAAPLLREILAVNAEPSMREKAFYLLSAAALEMGGCAKLAGTRPQDSAGAWALLSGYWTALCQRRQGLDSSAEESLRGVLKAPGNSPIKIHALALLTEITSQGSPRDAQKLLAQVKEQADRSGLQDLSAWARLSQAHLLYRLRRFEAAQAAYGAFAESYPRDPQRTLALYQKGLALRRMERADAAITAFKSLVVEHPDSAYASDAHMQLGQLYGETGRSDKAVSHYHRMGRSGGKDSQSEALLLAAQVHYNNKRYAQAIPYYWRILELSPDDARSRQVQDLLLTSYWLGARNDPGLIKAANLYPDHPVVARVRWELAAQAYKADDCRTAILHFEKFEAEYPDSPKRAPSLFYRAECLRRRGDADAAASAYRSLLKEFPAAVQARQASLALGRLLFDSQLFTESAEVYGTLGGPEALYNRALAFAAAGKKSAELAAYEQLLTRHPKHPKAGSAWMRVGQLREHQGRYKTALAAYARAQAPAALLLLRQGRCLEALKRHRHAVATYAKLVRLTPSADPDRLRGLLRMGLLLEMESQPLKAMRAYAEVLKHSPRDDAFEVARKRLSALSRDGSLLSSR